MLFTHVVHNLAILCLHFALLESLYITRDKQIRAVDHGEVGDADDA